MFERPIAREKRGHVAIAGPGLAPTRPLGEKRGVHDLPELETKRRVPRYFLGPSTLKALVFACASAACGPSVQSIYEGNVRFEHCYRLDLEVDVAPTHRQACWTEWLATYTFGQPRDRIEYARRRVRAFASGNVSAPKLEIGNSRKAETRQFYLMVPAPTSVHAPPPPVATRWYDDAGAAPTAPSAKTDTLNLPPGEQCGSGCLELYRGCEGSCASDGAAPSACTGCGVDYKACMQRCFR
jgi:hypothetical protein